MASSPPAIELDRVVKAFAGGRGRAVDEVSLSIPEGQFLALVGASGSGKTTTLKMINRLIQPDSGAVRVFGEDVRARPGHELRRHIGYVIQGVGLFPHLTVAQNIAVTPQLLGHDAARIRTRGGELLELVGLSPEYGARMPAQLSGGERQRVGIARAMAAAPRLMLMDEPFGALDPLTRHQLSTAMRSLHETLGLTTVMVTHDMMEAIILADRIVVMDRGRVIADGAAVELMSAHADPKVADLMDMPRRHFEAVRAILAKRPSGDG